jgi:hypothetical protein
MCVWYIYICILIYVYIDIYICMCACVLEQIWNVFVTKQFFKHYLMLPGSNLIE